MALTIDSLIVPKAFAYKAMALIPKIDRKIFEIIMSDDFMHEIGLEEEKIVDAPIKSSLKK